MSFGVGAGVNLGSATGYLFLDPRQFSKSLAQTGAQIDAFFAKQGKATTPVFQNIASGATRIATVTGLVIAGATAAFVSFEEAMTKAFSIMDVGESQMAEMSEQVQRLSVSLGIAPQVLAEGLYEVAQAGFEGEKAFAIMEVAAKASVAGMTDVATAAKPLIAILNAYGDAAGSNEEIMNTLFAGVTEGIFTFEELAQQMGDNIPLAAALDVRFEELIAAYIALTRQSNSLAESTTQLNGIMNSFLKPTEAMNKVLADIGIESGAALIEQEGLAGAVQIVTEAVGEEETAMAALFPNIRGLRGVVGLLTRDNELLEEATRAVANAQLDGGAAARTFEKQTESTAFQLRQAREQIRNAAIDLGEGFAPAVLRAAQVLGSLAQQFSEFSSHSQAMISTTTLIVFGLSTAVIALTKFGVALVTAGRAIKAFVIALKSVRTAMLTTGIGIAIVALGYLVDAYLRASERAKGHQQAVEDLDTAYKNLSKTISDLRLEDEETRAETAERGLTNIESTIAAVNDAYSEMGEAVSEWEILVHGADQAMQSQSLTMEEYERRTQVLPTLIDQVKKSQEELGDANAVGAKAMEVFDEAARTSEVDLVKFEQALNGLLIMYEGHLITGPRMIEMLDEMANNLSNWEVVSEEATEQAIQQAAADEALVKAQDDLVASTKDLATSTLAALKGMEKDWVSFVDGVQGGLAEIDESAAKIANRIFRQRRGAGLFAGADKDIQRAVELVRALEKVEAQVDAVEAAIDQNASDLSMWQGRIDLATDTIGLNAEQIQEWQEQVAKGEITQAQFNDNIEWLVSTEGMPKLQQLVDEGRLTQEQANKVRDDSIWLIQRSAGAILDEEAATALQVSQLANYVRRHDEADGAVKDATAAQQEFIAALQSSNAQLALQTLQMLLYLAAIGAIPASVVTDFIADASAVDPVVAGLFQDLALLDKEGKVTIEFNPETGRFEQVKDDVVGQEYELPTHFGAPDTSAVDQAKQDVATAVTIPFSFQGAPGGEVAPTSVTPAPAAEPLPLLATNKTATEVEVTITPPEAKQDVEDINTAVENLPDEVTSTVTLDISSANEAKTTVETLSTDLQTIFVEIATDATRLGESAGLGFKSKLSTNLILALNVTESIRNSIAATMGFLPSMLFQIGLNAGGSFVAGLSGSLRGGISTAYLIAVQIGEATEKGIQDALQSGSPSRVAITEGENFARSLAQGMAQQEALVAQESYALGQAMRTGIVDPFAGTRSAFSALTPGTQNINNLITPTAQTHVLIHQDVTVPAANFREWIDTVQYVQGLDQGFSTTLASKRGR